ncbi:uncharacterized protein LAESUDRAFT_726108 [Laetiporus sulphureus 93-53]|uniref:RNA-binding domain-containing protein n=1 Tax=Laetiporus sulphureus 93-53 TaxID=1314785 RepID=A0A165E5J6_9APHY|nr:uncharacterized protein LAESUDRAFT_726108 [Laetiporus sulphureus 93-53]KZT06279.1 hypothetical protein LAESUDRAFT_726108 [Laetiporus sulphureus 93-53]
MDEQPRDVVMSAPSEAEAPTGGHPTDAAPAATNNADYVRGGSTVADSAEAVSGAKSDSGYHGDKQVKPNKVYIGGLPEHTRKEDLESCFGKIGNIVNIELKVGYGFVEFDNREAAEESVAKYNEGYFMGNKIRVELSHGRGRTAKYSNDPGACFKCGQMGHWARECPNHTIDGHRRPGPPSDAPLIDRIQPPRDYVPPPRDYPPAPYREDYRYIPPPRDARYPYDYPPSGRDYRRPPSPPRDYRDYPLPVRPPREYDDYRMRPPPPPTLSTVSRYESRPGYYPPEGDAPPPPPPSYRYGPPPRDYYDRYDRRTVPSTDRYAAYPPPPPSTRSRTPPGGPPPPRARDDFDRLPARDYVAPPVEGRGRPATPPPSSRYADYPPARGASPEGPTRYRRRRSQSPPPRSAAGGYDAPYTGGSGGAPYTGGSSGSFSGNGYANGGSASRGSGARDYPPRGGRDAGEPGSGYSRRP